MKKLYITLIVQVFFFLQIYDATAQIVTIPDVNFKAALVANSAINTNGDTEIQVSEAQAYTGFINVSSKSISDMTGLTAFINIDSLNCYYNNLTTLDISANTLLTYVNCARNQLATLNTTSNTVINKLDCGYNQITNLNLVNNSLLKYLMVQHNQLSSLDISNNSLLRELWAIYNNLTSLNVSQNTQLTLLDCGYNQLTNLNVSNNTSLYSLSCTYNVGMGTIDVTNNTILKQLSCSGLGLSTLNLTNNTLLEQLTCSQNNLTTIDVSNNPAIWNFNCGNNQFTTINVSNNLALSVFTCWNNMMTSIDVTNNLSLTQLKCFNNQLNTIDVTQNPQLIVLECGDNLLTNLDISANPLLKSLHCENNQLPIIDVTNKPDLYDLRCGGNQLTSVDVTTNPALKWFYCDNNLLTSLNVSNNQLLQTLDCRWNPNLQCLSILPSGLLNLYTHVYCLPNIPTNLPAGFVLCSSLASTNCFLYPSVTGHVFVDMNNDGTQNAMDFNATERIVFGGVFHTATNSNGDYNLALDTNVTQNISIQNFNSNYFTLSPTSIPITTINTSAQVFPNSDFRLVPIGTQDDVEAHLVGGLYRPGFNSTIAFVCENVGNTSVNPVVTVNIDAGLTVLSSSLAPNGALGNNMTFSLAAMNPFDKVTIYVDIQTAISLTLGIPIVNSISIAVTNDVTPANNSVTENAQVIGAYDPNDKIADINYLTTADVAAQKPINYTIRFQNTGTLPADFVIVTDTLEEDLDISSLELISTSHALSKMEVETDITHPNQPTYVKWYFYNINLPDSASNEPKSHGYIRFRISPKTGLPLGTLVENLAGIVFDFNTPVFTDTCIIPVSDNIGIRKTLSSELGYSIFPNPAQNILYIKSPNSEEYAVSLFSINGQLIYASERETEMAELQLGHLQSGLYFLHIKNKQGVFSQKILVE